MTTSKKKSTAGDEGTWKAADKPRLQADLKKINKYAKPGTFTIFCQGTGGHREGRCLELITELSAAYWGRDAQDTWGRGTEDYQLTGTPVPLADRGDGVRRTNHDFYREHYLNSFLILDGVGTTDMAENPPDQWLPGTGKIDPAAESPYSKANPLIPLGLMGEGDGKEVGRIKKAWRWVRRKDGPAADRKSLTTKHPMPGDFVFDRPDLTTPLKPLRPGARGQAHPELDVLETADEVLFSAKTEQRDGHYHLSTDGETVDRMIPVAEVTSFVPRDPTARPTADPINERTSARPFVDERFKTVIGHHGTILGDGWDDNVAYAINVLRRLHDEGRFPAVINMIGWSRGGVTCFKLANAIHDHFVDGGDFYFPPRGSIAVQDTARQQAQKVLFPKLDRTYPDLVVNMFPIDPVPGLFGGSGGSWMGSSRMEERFPTGITDIFTIPPCVKDCLVALAMDEQRASFAPVDAKQVKYRGAKHPEHTIAFLPFPAIHRTLLRLEPSDPEGKKSKGVRRQLTASPLVVFDLALRFLHKRGTELQVDYRAARKGHWPNDRALSPENTVELYSAMKHLRHAYHAGRNKGAACRAQGGMIHGLKARRFTGRDFSGVHLKKDTGHKSDRELYRNKNHELSVYVRDFKFFVNEHHRAAFEKAYPDLYQWLAGTPPADMNSWQDAEDDDVGRLLAKLKTDYPNTFNALVAIGLTEKLGRHRSFELPKRFAVKQGDDPGAAALRKELVEGFAKLGLLSKERLMPSLAAARMPV